MIKRDYYEVLNLTPSCTPLDVRQSYRKLALKWHPDKCLNIPGAKNKFTEIQEAYSILSDERKKQIYDTYGHQGIEFDQDCNGQAQPNKKNFFFEKGFQGTDKSAFDILKDIFQENDDTYFFDKFDEFEIPDNLKDNMKTFINENIFTQENENTSNFFETYVPTFASPDFFMAPPGFETTKEDDAFSTQFFSSMFTGTGEQSYSRTSTTFMHNGKVTTSVHESFQTGNNFYETQEKNNYYQSPQQNQPNYVYSKNCGLYEPFYNKTEAHIDPNIIILDDVDEDKNNILFDVFNDIKTFMDFSSEKFTTSDLKMQEDSRLNMASKKISKEKNLTNIRLTNKKPSKKSKG